MTPTARTATTNTAEIEVPWEQHFTLTQLSKRWGFARGTLARWFADEPGILRMGSSRLRRGRRSAYVSMRIPESVAMRVYRRHLEAK
jgi:hypothetical protein